LSNVPVDTGKQKERKKKAHLKTLAAPDDTFMKAKREKQH